MGNLPGCKSACGEPPAKRMTGLFYPRPPLWASLTQAELHKTREAPHKQNFDQGGSPQAELRPGSLPTSRITTRDLAGWLAGWRNYDEGACPALCWLAGWGAGWLAEAQRGPERRIMYRTSLSCAWLEALNKQILEQGGSPHISLDTCICVEPERMPPRTTTMFTGFQTEIHVKPRASHKQAFCVSIG